MCTQSTTSVFTRNWVVVLAGNISETIYIVVLYCVYFADSTSIGTRCVWTRVGSKIMTCLAVVGSVNFGTLYIYIYEKAFRRLYIADKKLQAVSPEN